MEGVPEVDLDLRLEGCAFTAIAMGSPHSVSAYVGNPPSTGTKIPSGEVREGDALEGLRGPAELSGDDMVVFAASPPADRCSLAVEDDAPVDPEWPLSLWRPFCCPDLGAGATSESGPVDRLLRIGEVVVTALAALGVSQTDWSCLGAGDWAPAGASPLTE